ncbi:MAG: DUF349 domain-containing protein [Gammaproteobacteria bacterium]|jgi:hypothetical protein
MNKKTSPPNLGNRQAILDEIHFLLETAGGIDETRAKKVRKAIDALRNSSGTPADGQPPSAEDPPAAAGLMEEQPGAEAGLDAEIDAGLETLRARIHAQVERRNHDYEKSLGLMDELETALKDNELQQAERAYHKLMSIMGNIPGLSEQRWQDIDKRLNRVRPQLRKLESWRHWGTTLARKDLIEQVKELSEAGLSPEKLAAEIKQAREQWHTWDKSGDNAGKALWKEFDRTCEAAYKPCIAHFEKLKQRRKDNLKQRRAIIEGLNARYAETDWNQPDWREIDKAIRHARRDFYKIGNVDFKHRKPLARALDEALEKYEAHLGSERERSIKAREKLIADIEALAEVASLRTALDQLETLKKQWRITVTGKRELENRLWKRFQAACDSTYRRRDAERKEQDAERNTNLTQKQALIEELARIATASDAELLANASALGRVRHQWEAIGWIPRKHESSLDSRWRAAQKQFSSALKAAKSRAKGAELDNLARRAALCHQWEQATLNGNTPDADSIRTEWDALPALSGSNDAAIQQRYSQALKRPDDTTLSGNLAAKQAACLKLEVQLELESPAECQAERMAYQIERLNASLKKELETQASPEDLLLTLLTTGAVPAEAAAAIEQRIGKCLAQYKHQT